MITSSLISEALWSDVPEEPREAFLYLAMAARQRLLELSKGDDDYRAPYSARDWQRQYVWELSSIAHGLGVPGLPAPESAQQNQDTLADFDAQLARIITGIRIELRANLRTESVQLSYTTKNDIRSQLEDLRATVNSSNLSDDAKASLHKKIDAVEAELENRRTSLRPFWILAGAFAAVVQGTIGTLADAPDANKLIQDIVDVVHQEKNDEDQIERRKIEPDVLIHEPLRRLEDKSKNANG